jgi:hypothetical protein
MEKRINNPTSFPVTSLFRDEGKMRPQETKISNWGLEEVSEYDDIVK